MTHRDNYVADHKTYGGYVNIEDFNGYQPAGTAIRNIIIAQYVDNRCKSHAEKREGR